MIKIMKYPGSKLILIPEITDKYNKSGKKYFIDVFAGSGSVIMNIKSEYKIYNDINTDLVFLFNTLKNNYNIFYKNISKVVSTKKTFYDYYDKRIDFMHNNIYNALKTFYDFNVNFGGMGNTYSKIDKSLYGNIKKNIDNLNLIKNDIIKWNIENMDFKELIKKYDNSNVFFYLDPPYPGKNWYEYNFNADDFMDLNNIIKNMKGNYLMNFNKEDELPLKIFGAPSYIKKYINKNGKTDKNDLKFRYVSFYTNL